MSFKKDKMVVTVTFITVEFEQNSKMSQLLDGDYLRYDVRKITTNQ